MGHKTLLDELLAIPRDAERYVIDGVEMRMIDRSTFEQALSRDPEGMYYLSVTTAAGTFLVTKKDGRLETLSKVRE